MAQFTNTTKQVNATITKIDGRALRGNIQTACLHVIGHAMAFGHSPLANALNDRMGSIAMLRKLAKEVQQYLSTFGPFNYSETTGFVFSKTKRDALHAAAGGTFDYEEFVLTASDWDDMPKKQSEAKTLDMLKELEKLADRGAKKAINGEVIDADLIPYLRALIGQYAGEKALKAMQARVAAEAAAKVAAEAEAEAKAKAEVTEQATA